MNTLTNFNRKLIYGLVIVVLFGVDVPLHAAGSSEEKKHATWARRPSARSIPAAS